MKYAHIISAFNRMPWAIMPDKLAEVTSFLELAASGVVLDKEMVRAQFGAARSTTASRAGSVAVIPMFGMISQRTNMMQDYSGGVSVTQLQQGFREAMADDSVQSIVFHSASPGGGVFGVPEFAEEVYSARGQGKRIISFTDQRMCSAALWIGAAADEIVVTETSETGCRGVLCAHVDVSGAEEMLGQKTTLIVSESTPQKIAGHPYQPLTDEDKAAIQADVNYYGEMFDESYAKYRGVALSDVKSGHGQGATLIGANAVAAGIADRVDTFDNLIADLLAPDARSRSRSRSAARLALKSV